VRAQANPDLDQALVSRKSIPPEYLNQLYARVDTELRATILQRNAGYSEAEIATALERAKTKLSVDCGALPNDYQGVVSQVEAHKRANTLSVAQLPALWRDQKMTQFLVSFAALTELDYHQSQVLFAGKDIDSIAMVCRAAGFERALFVTLAVLVLNETGMGQAKVLGEMYNEVPQEAAQRALRFMKLRSTALAQAA
jgi:uncharacterized protein (DUF2336 family)